MGRVYSASFSGIAVSAIQDLWEIVASSADIVLVHEVRVSQQDLTALENLRLKFHRGSTSGSGGGTVTPVAFEPGDPASGATVERNNTTQSTEGSILFIEEWNVVHPFVWQPTPENRIVLAPSGRLNIELEVAPSGATDMSSTVIFEEIG